MVPLHLYSPPLNYDPYRASLPSILSLLGLWLVLFIFFAILYVEVFGLTKWGGYETPTTNYYSLGNAMLMLSFQSTGCVNTLDFMAVADCKCLCTVERAGISTCTICRLSSSFRIQKFLLSLMIANWHTLGAQATRKTRLRMIVVALRGLCHSSLPGICSAW